MERKNVRFVLHGFNVIQRLIPSLKGVDFSNIFGKTGRGEKQGGLKKKRFGSHRDF